LEIKTGRTRSRCIDNLLWNRPWTCHKADYRDDDDDEEKPELNFEQQYYFSLR
jgi:hypothetical protein